MNVERSCKNRTDAKRAQYVKYS